MGSVWLGSLPQVLRDAGLNVQTWQGWETRSRSSGGYDKVWAIGVHHDAISTGTSLNTRCRNAWESSPDRPIGAMWLHTDGTYMVGAAGATNTQGKGGPYNVSKGTIPLDAGNRYMLSIEASNNGVGEVWPAVQQDAYRRGCAALCRWLGLDPNRDVVAHFEWTTRKIDPAGNSDYAVGGAKWNMGRFRQDIARIGAPVPPDPSPTPGGNLDMIRLDYGLPGTDSWWTRMLLSGNTITWVQGHANDQLDNAVPSHIQVMNDQHMHDLLTTFKAVGPPPSTFASNASLTAAWQASAAR